MTDHPGDTSSDGGPSDESPAVPTWRAPSVTPPFGPAAADPSPVDPPTQPVQTDPPTAPVPVGAWHPYARYGEGPGSPYGAPPVPPGAPPGPWATVGGGGEPPSWLPPSYGPGGGWGYGGLPQPHPRPGGRGVAAVAVALGVVVAALAGGLVGHEVWGGATFQTPSALAPSAQTPASTTPGAGAPQDAQAIAQRVDPGLVDVNTQLTISGQPAVGAGTGMVLTPGGEVLTNNHVIEGASKISVTDVGNGRTYGANVVGYDRAHDVAVLQLVGASGLQTVTTGNSSTLSVGQGVVAIGNAQGAGGTPSYAGGSITALNQTITASDEATGTSEQLTGLIQTNADIVSGDSGGALVNANGRVIGMNTAASSGYQFQSPSSQGYAIPINAALAVVHQIEGGSSTGTVHVGPTAFLGVEVESASSGGGGGGFFGGRSGSSSNGATVVGLVNGGAAAQAGLVPGDVITSLDGHPVTSAESLTNVMVLEKPGKSVSVTYLNTSGQQATTSVTLASGPPQ